MVIVKAAREFVICPRKEKIPLPSRDAAGTRERMRIVRVSASGSLEYSVERKEEDGEIEMTHGDGIEMKVGGETFSCSAPDLSGAISRS